MSDGAASFLQNGHYNQKSQIYLLQEKSAKQPISFYISFSFVPHGIRYPKITKF